MNPDYDAHPVVAHPSIARMAAALRGEPLPADPDAAGRDVRVAGLDQPPTPKRRRVGA